MLAEAEFVELENDIDEEFRFRARQDLLAFTMYTKEDYSAQWHHRALCRKLNAFIRGEIKYLMVWMPPRHGKSELVSRRLPAYLHGLYPEAEIMAVSYLDSLAADMTIDVQKILDSREYQELFPETKIFPSRTQYSIGTRNSSEHHIVGHRGKYRGQGVGGSFTGKGANFIIIDDPIKGREIADSEAFRERLWNFWTNDLYTRLETDLKTGRQGQVLITQCMTGETPVLMADGTQRFLCDIKTGDSIATYENGYISSSTVKNWKCQGSDVVFAIKMSSGITVKANERHPFLVSRHGVLEWVRLRGLQANDKLVCAVERGRESRVPSMDAKYQRDAKDIAHPTITKLDGQPVSALHPLIQNHEGSHTFDKDTDLAQRTTQECSKSKTENAPYVESPPLESIVPPTGTRNYALTTTTARIGSGHSSATNATSLSDTETLKKYCSEPLSIYEITLDCIVEIVQVGREDVFDIQVERTENFIANGLISHNTRWHEADLSGQLIEQMKKDEKAIQWEIVHFPAIRVDMDNPDDPRPVGEALWPAKYNLTQLAEIEASTTPRGWSAVYQQNPVPGSGDLFKEHMFEFCDLPGGYDWQFITADTAYKEKQRNDFTVFTAWGVRGEQAYITDVYYKQIASNLIEADVLPFIKPKIKYGFRGTYIEPKGHGIYLNQKFASEGIMIPSQARIDEFYSDRNSDKVARANNVLPHLARRKIYISNHIPNKKDLVAQCLGFPNVRHDDFCFHGDTLIATTSGDIPIKDLSKVDMVLTPFGPRRITACGQTGIRPVILKGGLVATADHPVFQFGKGFIPIDIMVDAFKDSLSCGSQIRWSVRKQLSLMEPSFDEWAGRDSIISASQKLTQDEGILRACTLQFGKLLTKGQFAKAFTFITRMAIHSITVPIIWNVYRAKSTTRCLRNSISNYKERIWKKLDRWLPCGTGLPKEENGIARMLRGSIPKIRNVSARFAEKVFWLNSLTSSIVQSRVNTAGAPFCLGIRSQGLVPTAVKNSLLEASLSFNDRQPLAPLAAEENFSKAKAIPVYNLTVAGSGCYYANGILVSNCDTVIDGLKMIYSRKPSILDSVL